MKKVFLSILILCAGITSFAQTSADYNYSIAVRGFSMMQLPKILNQTNTQDYTRMAGNGAILKFNDNQISYRIVIISTGLCKRCNGSAYKNYA